MKAFGQINGHPIGLYEIVSAGGLRAAITPFGARLVQLWLPDRDGRFADVVLGHDCVEDYLTYPTYFGATCGRYANRISGGQFALNGKVFQLDINEGLNHLHGGSDGFDRKIWQISDLGTHHIAMSLQSPDGDMGYPGACRLHVCYRFEAERLTIEMQASTDTATVVNLVNHSYFNLAGGGSVLDHSLQISAEFYTPVAPDLLTTGEVRSVEATGFDFRTPRTLQAAMTAQPDLNLGYDHNWCLSGAAPAVRLSDPVSGRRLRLWTNQPGVQIYTCGQMAQAVPGKAGESYGRFSGLTLETQRFPCSPNHPHFPSAVLQPDAVYAHQMAFEFDVLA